MKFLSEKREFFIFFLAYPLVFHSTIVILKIKENKEEKNLEKLRKGRNRGGMENFHNKTFK